MGCLHGVANFFDRVFSGWGQPPKGQGSPEAGIEHTETVTAETPGNPETDIERTTTAEAPEDQLGRSNRLNNLSIDFNTRYKQFGDLNDLEGAIRHAEAALAAAPVDHPNHATILSNLSSFLGSRYQRLGNLGDLEVAIEHIKAAVTETPEDHPDRAGRLSNLSSRLDSRYERLGDLSDLEAAIRHAEASVAAALGDHPYRASSLNQLSTCLSTRYKRFGDLRDLEAAIEHVEAALAATPRDRSDTNWVGWLNNLSNFLGGRYRRLGDLSDLEAAIEHAEAVIAATPEDHPNRAGRLSGLSNHFSSQYQRLGDLSDLKEAIKHAEAALAATPLATDPYRASRLNTLSDRFSDRYQRLGDLSDLETSIGHAKAALAATPEDHPSRASRLETLGKCFNARYERLGDLNDLEVAIRHAEEAVEATPGDQPNRAGRLTILGTCFNDRYERLGAISDLEAAIEHSKAAVSATPVDRPDRPGRLNNLSINLDARYQRLGDLNDLETAIKHAKAALVATPADHPNYALILSNLSALLLSLYQKPKDPRLSDLEAAIKYAEAAVAATPEDHHDRAGRLCNLSSSLEVRYQQLGDLRDLEAAIEHGEDALVETPIDHPACAGRLTSIGISFILRYNSSGSSKDRERAFASFLGAWNCEESPPLIRVLAAWHAVKLFPSRQTWDKSSALLEAAVKMMPKISLRSLEREDQQEVLSKLYGLSSDAAAVALQAGRGASHALTLLELGRGIIMGFAIDHKGGELSELKATNPDLFSSFTRLRIEINSPVDKSLQVLDGYRDQNRGFVLNKRKQAMEDIELTLSDIRRIPAYKDFLLPPPPENLMKMAEDGAIVVFNTTLLRSDAIIVTASAIKTVELPKLVYAEAKEQMRQMAEELVHGTLRTLVSRNKRMNKLLFWLWDVAVEPVLEELKLCGAIDHDASATDSLTRIWWIGVGELSMAPFHAAGDYSAPDSTRNTLSRVISSYIPTIKALSYSRQKKLELASTPDTPSRLLLVTMPTTPNGASLPNVEEEARVIVEIVEKGTVIAQTTVLKHPSAAEVLEKLHLYNAVHFACHGVPDGRDPSNSSLILLKSNGTNDRLTVRDISSTNTENAQLAYLSACCTADNPAVMLGDETIHLASAFQLVGFNHVIATMWRSKDEACMEVARDFYSSLFGGKEGDGGHREVGMALHKAVKRLRAKKANMPLIWASFIHTGA